MESNENFYNDTDNPSSKVDSSDVVALAMFLFIKIKTFKEFRRACK